MIHTGKDNISSAVDILTTSTLVNNEHPPLDLALFQNLTYILCMNNVVGVDLMTVLPSFIPEVR